MDKEYVIGMGGRGREQDRTDGEQHGMTTQLYVYIDGTVTKRTIEWKIWKLKT